jgi:electron transport complex protein RnfB
MGTDGLPTKKVCPRDAIKRTVIGDVDPDDPLNNFYEYTIDEELCNGCGRCVMECKDPAGLGSIRLEVRYDRCLHCNQCTIATHCPDDAYARVGPQPRPAIALEGEPA